MKRYRLALIFCISTLALTSCDKNYTCECYESAVPVTYELDNDTRQQAKFECDALGRQIFRNCELK